MNRNRKIAEFIIGIIIAITIIAVVLLGLEYFAGPGVIAKFLEFLPGAIFSSIVALLWSHTFLFVVNRMSE